MTAYTNHGKTSSAKRNSGRKPKLSEIYRRIFKRIVSKNRVTTTAKMTAELSIYLQGPVSTKKKKSEESFPNTTSMTELQWLNV